MPDIETPPQEVEEDVRPEIVETVPTVTPESLMEDVAEGARIYSELTDRFIDGFEFYERTLKEWGQFMVLQFPEEFDEENFRKVLLELAKKHQLAHNYYSLANSLAKAFSGGAELKKSDVVAAIVTNFLRRDQRRPAGTIVERMADSYMKSTVSSRVAATIVRDFWKQRLEMFDEQRRILDAIGISLHCEMKFNAS